MSFKRHCDFCEQEITEVNRMPKLFIRGKHFDMVVSSADDADICRNCFCDAARAADRRPQAK